MPLGHLDDGIQLARIVDRSGRVRGELSTTPRAPPRAASSSASADIFQPSAALVSTTTGSALASRAIAGYDTQNGAGTSTRSPGPKSVNKASNRTCFAPALTSTSAGEQVPPHASSTCTAIASRKGRRPAAGG